MNTIQASYEKEETFKLICNSIFKAVKYFIQEPLNPLNVVVPVKYEDLEFNDSIFAQLQCLCFDFEVEVDKKQKGVFLRFTRNDKAYLSSLQGLLDAFKIHKDESIAFKSRPIQKSNKFSAMDPNKEERVSAYLEAKRLRAIVAPRAPDII